VVAVDQFWDLYCLIASAPSTDTVNGTYCAVVAAAKQAATEKDFWMLIFFVKSIAYYYKRFGNQALNTK